MKPHKTIYRRILKGEKFAAEGKHTNVFSNEEILLKLSRFNIIFHKDIRKGKEQDLSGFGKWRIFERYMP